MRWVCHLALGSMIILTGCEAAPEVQYAPAPKTGNVLSQQTSVSPHQVDFQIGKVPVSTVPLTDFPYIQLPAGFLWANGAQETRGVDEFQFWNGEALFKEKGRLFMGRLQANGGNYQPSNLKTLLDNSVAALGGVKIAQGRLSPQTYAQLSPDYITQKWDVVGDLLNADVMTWIIRRSDSNIIIHATIAADHAAMAIIHTQPYKPQSILLPVSKLSHELTTNGVVSVEILIKPDNKMINPVALPQLQAIKALLNQDQTLNLEIIGHNDNRAPSNHNFKVSVVRAELVRDWLITAGISPERLVAKGVGDTQPLFTDNTEEAKTRNRRIELKLMSSTPAV